MHLSLLTNLPVLLLTLFTPALASVAVPLDVHATAVEIDDSNSRIYYQASDTSIHELSSFGSAGSGGSLIDKLIIPPGIARAATPLASLVIGSYMEIHLFYIGNGYGGAQVCEYVYSLATNSWADGPINAIGFTNFPGSPLLYTLSVATKPSNPYGVGFVCSTGLLCEAVHNDTKGWTVATY